MAMNLEDPTGGFLDPLGFFDKDKTLPYTSNKSAFDTYAGEMDAAAKEQQANADKWNPWTDRGNRAGDAGFNAYQRDLADPNYMQDKIASGFSMSPYQTYMQDLVSKRLNYNAANSGMQGSGAANRALMEELTKSTGQFQGEYIKNGLGLYGQALSGMNGIAGQGLQAGQLQNELLKDKNEFTLEGAGGRLKGTMGENETTDRNNGAMAARDAGMKGAILGAFGTAAGAYFGGPAGAKAGGEIGNSIGQGSPAGKYQGPISGGGGGASGNWSY